MKTETTIQANPKIQQSEKSQFRQYATYKPSNVEWLGDVPSHWKVTRLINRTVQIVGGDWGDDPELESDEHVLLPVIRVQDIENEYEIGDEKLTYRKIKASKIDHRLIDNKTLLIEKSGGGEKQLVGRVAIPKKITMPAICSNFMEKIEMDEQAVPSFFNYIFHALYNRNMNFPFVQQTTGIQNLKSTYYFYTKVAYPTPTEQTAIAAYLDQATANIDKVIATKQKQLEKLEQYKQSKIHECVTGKHRLNLDLQDEKIKGLKSKNPEIQNISIQTKDSGIDWIGDVPRHWKVERVKDVVQLRTEKTSEKSEVKDYLELEDMEQWTGKIIGFRDTTEVSSDVTMFKKGDVLFGKLRPYLAKYWLADRDGKCTGEIIAFNCLKIQNVFFKHFIGSPKFIELCTAVSYGAKMPRVDWTRQIAYFYISFPDKEEQIEIANYIEEFTDKISKEKSIIEQQIEKLKQYRKCLIHECVTGKRKVINE